MEKATNGSATRDNGIFHLDPLSQTNEWKKRPETRHGVYMAKNQRTTNSDETSDKLSTTSPEVAYLHYPKVNNNLKTKNEQK